MRTLDRRCLRCIYIYSTEDIHTEDDLISDDDVHEEAEEYTETADEEIRDLLNVPNSFRVLNCVALGKKGEFKNEYLKENLSFENIHYESY